MTSTRTFRLPNFWPATAMSHIARIMRRDVPGAEAIMPRCYHQVKVFGTDEVFADRMTLRDECSCKRNSVTNHNLNTTSTATN
jgi:hypothetical protein